MHWQDDPLWRTQRGPFAGKDGQVDVPYVPTPMPVVERLLDLAEVGPGTNLVDLGCGDGRILIAAARRGARARGIELVPERIAEARAAVRDAGVEASVTIELGDIFAADLSDADAVVLFLLVHVNRWIEPKLKAELRPGARVVSYIFPMPNWVPAAEEKIDQQSLYLWVR